MKLAVNLFRNLPNKYRNYLKDSELYDIYFLFLNLKLGFSKTVFFSQTGEDELILKWLPEQHGLYMDIELAACLRIKYLLLLQKGWKGICVDPIRDNFRMLKLIRRRDTIIQVLVSSRKGKRIFISLSHMNILQRYPASLKS